MPTIADADRPVTGGVDTHAQVHVAAMVGQAGRVLETSAGRYSAGPVARTHSAHGRASPSTSSWPSHSESPGCKQAHAWRSMMPRWGD
jgi:hypothetical protein